MWKKTTAIISHRRALRRSFFKWEYSLMLRYKVDIYENFSNNEIQLKKENQKIINELSALLNDTSGVNKIFEESELIHRKKKIICIDKIVSNEDFAYLSKKKNVEIVYHAEHPENIQFI